MGASLTIRRATAGDCAWYLICANDPDVRDNSFDHDCISSEVHDKWFAARLADADSFLYVFECAGIRFGQVRFNVQADGVALLDFSICKTHRGRAWAVEMVSVAVNQLFVDSAVRTVTASTFACNVPCIRTLLGVGMAVDADVLDWVLHKS